MLRRALLLSLVFTILLLPWYVVRFKLFGLPITLLECFAVITIALWAIYQINTALKVGLLVYLKNALRWLALYRLVLLIVVLFVMAATMAVVWSNNVTAALGIYKAYIIEPMLIFVVIATTVRNPREWWLLIGAFVGMSLQVSVSAICQQLLGWPNFAPNELVQGRSSAMFNTANAVGLLIGPITLVMGCIGAYLWQKNKLVSMLIVVASLLNLLAIYYSQSSGAMVAIVGAILIGLLWLALSRQKWFNVVLWSKLVAFGLAVYTIATLIFIWVYNQPPQVANPYTRPGFNTFTVRQCTWEGTAKMLADRPITGSGLAGFSDEYLRYATCDAEPLVYPHNLILNFWVELGVSGLLASVLMLTYWLWKSGVMAISRRSKQMIYLGLMIVPLYWLIHGLVDVPYFKNDLAMIWWGMFGLLLVAERSLMSSHNID